MNGSSPLTPESLPPSPADDPLDRLSRATAELKDAPGSEAEDTGRFDVSRTSIRAQGIPRWSMGLFAVLVGLGVAVAGAAWAIHMLK